MLAPASAHQRVSGISRGQASRIRLAGSSAQQCRVRPSQLPKRSCITKVAHVDTTSWEEEVLKSDKPVLVKFWAHWCGPCKLVAPLLDWVDKEYEGSVKVAKVQYDNNPKLIAQYKVYGLPTLLVVKDGQVVEGSKREGAISKALLAEYLKKHGIAARSKVA